MVGRTLTVQSAEQEMKIRGWKGFHRTAYTAMWWPSYLHSHVSFKLHRQCLVSCVMQVSLGRHAGIGQSEEFDCAVEDYMYVSYVSRYCPE